MLIVFIFIGFTRGGHCFLIFISTFVLREERHALIVIFPLLFEVAAGLSGVISPPDSPDPSVFLILHYLILTIIAHFFFELF